MVRGLPFDQPVGAPQHRLREVDFPLFH